MSIETTAHLNFRGTARAGLTFYQSVFGGEIVLVTHSQTYPEFAPDEADHIAYGQVASAEGFRIMGFDVPAARPYDPGIAPVFVSVRGQTADEIQAYWDKLAEGATVLFPIAPSAWSPLYGMLTDRFGVTWVLDVAVAYPA